MAFGKEIKRLRDESLISAQKLADIIGINANRLRKWEEKDLDPRLEDVQKIEAFFGMNLQEVQKLESIKKFLIVPYGTIKSLTKKLPGDHNVTLQDHLNLLNKHASIMQRLVEARLLSADQVNSDEPQKSVQHTDQNQGERKSLPEIPEFGGKSGVRGHRAGQDKSLVKDKLSKGQEKH